MNYTKSNKLKLLHGASALILGASATTAYAQSVTTTTTAVVPSTANTVKAQEQTNNDSAETTVDDNNFIAESLANITNSSVSLDDNGAEAIARGNYIVDTLTDAAAAEISTSNATTIDQLNTAEAKSSASGTVTLAAGNDISGSTIDVYNNNNLALAQGNGASTATSLTGYATNNADSTIASLQVNSGDNDIIAYATDNGLKLDLDSEVDGSRAMVTGNSDRSAATGNNLTQQMTLGGTTLGLDTVSASANTFPTLGGTGDTAGTRDVQASGVALISSLQINDDTNVIASTTGSVMEIDAKGTTGDTANIDGSVLDLSSNVQDATAIGSSVGNTMTLSGTTVGTGAAIVSAQSSTSTALVVAETLAQARILAETLGEDSGSSINLSDNKIQSRAAGGSVSNTMTVSATTVTLKPQDGTPTVDIGSLSVSSDSSLAGTVSGAFVTLNDQLIDSDTTATTKGSTGGTSIGSGFLASVDGFIDASTINNDRNTLSAQAQAAVATNSTTLTVGGSLTETDGSTGDTVANGAVIANIQQVADAARVEATVDASSAVSTIVTGAVLGSTVTASSNKVQAFAEGTTSTNVLTVSARTLNVADGSTGDAFTSAAPGGADADTAFAVANLQDSGTGLVAATLNDSVMIKTELGGDVDGSKVTSAGNMQDAFASSNKSTNALSLSATTLSGDAGLVNNQVGAADVQAWIGGNDDDTSGTFDAGDVGANAGVLVTVGQDIVDSAIAVTGNMVRGSAISNSGANSLTVAATTLSGDGNVGQAIALSATTSTTADYGLASYQKTEEGGSSETQVAATFGIAQDFDRDVTGSSLSVSNNTQFGEALANTVTNRVSIASTDVGAVGTVPATALNNNQYVDLATIDSTSLMTVYTNAASEGSSIALNGNSNTALGVANNASNILSVTGVTVDGSLQLVGVGSETTLIGNDAYATYAFSDGSISSTEVRADYAINNSQQSLGDNGLTGTAFRNGEINSTAGTLIFNTDAEDVFSDVDTGTTATSGLLNSSVTMSNNATTAEASANRALNSLSVSATNSAATAAVGNFQDSSNDVNAVASLTAVGMVLDVQGLTGGAATSDYVASGSTMTMANNSTTALARGNSASNALNYTVAASYDGVTTDAVNGGTAAAAAAVILNAQSNSGDVAATANSVSYRIALNDGAEGLAYGPINSSVSMTGNAVTAVAFGNTATNALTMATFNSGIPSSLNSNVQVNSGFVTAQASSANIGVYSQQAVQGSAIRNSGNSVSASAIGNNSVSTISGGN
jgi:hypothetical protein